jgi:hypothetical protein
LNWPPGYKRTQHRRHGGFQVRLPEAVDHLEYEIERIAGRGLIITSNLALDHDGLPRDLTQPADPGVAIYFTIGAKQHVIPADGLATVRDNVRGLGLTLQNLRSNRRYGVGQLMDRVLDAFVALPPTSGWRGVLKLDGTVTRADVEEAFRREAKRAHPDAGGSNELMMALIAARDAALKEIRGE